MHGLILDEGHKILGDEFTYDKFSQNTWFIIARMIPDSVSEGNNLPDFEENQQLKFQLKKLFMTWNNRWNKLDKCVVI